MELGRQRAAGPPAPVTDQLAEPIRVIRPSPVRRQLDGNLPGQASTELVDPAHRGVHADPPVEVPLGVGEELGQDPVPRPIPTETGRGASTPSSTARNAPAGPATGTRPGNGTRCPSAPAYLSTIFAAIELSAAYMNFLAVK